MPIYRAQVSWQQDSAFPRDAQIITPHFDIGAITHDPDQLAEDLCDAISAWQGLACETKVKMYDAQGTPPVVPVGEAVNLPGNFEAGTDPRELAVCLSFYGGVNQPRKRGRLYIPASICARGNTGSLRPSVAVRNKVAALVPIFTGLGGTDVDWCVYSRANDSMASVTNWWVDDEWDIIRSRGMRPTTRLTGTTSEG